MIPVHDLLVFAGASLLLVLTPGPNMLYLISRSICQGRTAGVTSLAGVVLGFCTCWPPAWGSPPCSWPYPWRSRH
jgi:threonine/homoserine/homoserine lactone efflux protein